MNWYYITFFQSSQKMPSSNIDLKSNWSGKTISFPHNLIILIDVILSMSFISIKIFYN